ncbi:hypothetical protein BJV74DRAFT_787001 [Russula compacta]|nr:hypothetical protein BJV74DRAFT_787001 [Russula compacta]
MSGNCPNNITYFTYGSNIWREQINRLYPDNIYVGVGLLHGWRFIVDELGWTNIIPSPEDHVYGLVYELTPEDKAAMDKNEGTDYKTTILPIDLTKIGEADTKTVKIDALIYFDPTHTTPGTPTEGTINAMNHAIKDGLEAGIPQSYIDKYIRPFIPKQ